MKFSDFIIPGGLDEARSVLRELGGRAFPVAGGTSLHFLADQAGKTAVDITRLGLDGIREEGGAFHVGAAATLSALSAYRAPGWVLNETAVRTATRQVRNVSTIGGNIARVFPWADFPPALLALDARMTVLGDEERELGADEYFESQPTRLFRKGELLTAVKVPAVARESGFAYHKEVLTSAGFSMVTAAAFLVLEGDRVASARVAAGAALSFPRRLPELEEELKGGEPGEARFEKIAGEAAAGLSWKGKEGMSDEYASHLAGVVLRDVLVAAWRRARG